MEDKTIPYWIMIDKRRHEARHNKLKKQIFHVYDTIAAIEEPDYRADLKDLSWEQLARYYSEKLSEVHAQIDEMDLDWDSRDE